MRMLAALSLLSALVACRGGDDDSTGGSDECPASCGDVDGSGGDSGDVPNILGDWTTTVGMEHFDDNCEISGISDGSDLPIHGAMEVKGRVPDQLYVVFSNNDSVRYFGLIAPNGGTTFSGTTTYGDDTLHVAFGGLVYEDKVYRDRTFIDGYAFVGWDIDGDDNIDCDMRGDWTATKSGA